MGNPFQSPSVLSLCPGILGLERGLERAIGPLRIAAYVEREAFLVENLLTGMEKGILDPAPIWTDVKTFDARPFFGKIHGIIGGYPCQPFSHAGHRKGTEDPRHLWPFIASIFRTARPVWGWLENVAGHLTMGFDKVYRDLSSMGYHVEAGIYAAEEVGASHRRERLFILAIMANAGSTEWWKDIASRYKYRKDQLFDEGKKIAGGVTQRGSILANPENDFRGLYAGSWRSSEKKDDTIGTSEVAYPSHELCNGSGRRYETGGNEHPNGCGEISDADERAAGQLEAGRRLAEGWPKAGRPASHGIQRIRTEGEQEPDIRIKEEIPWCNGRRTYWPARPGEPQFEWEEARTIEPRMGSTINGYNFREDLLRALGNSVVEQQAEFAFIDLMNKHCLHIK